MRSAGTNLFILVLLEDPVGANQDVHNMLEHVPMHGHHGSNETFGILFPIARDNLSVFLTNFGYDTVRIC